MKTMRIVIVGLVGILLAYSSHKNKYDVTGLFGTTEVVVSAEQNGRLLQLGITEGSEASRGQQVGSIDTVQLTLKARQIEANPKSIANQKPDVNVQIAMFRQQLKQAGQERQRSEGLMNDGVANRKQLGDTTSTVRVLKCQLAVQQSSLNDSTRALNSQISADDIQKYQVLDQLKKYHVTSPLTGIVLEKYAEEDEFTSIGRPLFKVINTKNLFLRACLTSRQLEKVKIGRRVTIFSNYGDDTSKEYKKKVIWISPRSELTPKTVLTDDERANQMYAVKITVQSDGHIKIGMYGKVRL